MKVSFYETLLGLVKSTPNNMELGSSVRSLVNKIEDSKKPKEIDPAQVSIFDIIKEN